MDAVNFNKINKVNNLIGVANPPQAGTNTIFNYIKKLDDNEQMIKNFLKQTSKLSYLSASISYKGQTVTVLNVSGSGFLQEAYIYYINRTGSYGRSLFNVYLDGTLIFSASTSATDSGTVYRCGIIHTSSIFLTSTGYPATFTEDNSTEHVATLGTACRKFVGIPYTVGEEGRFSRVINPLFFNSSLQIVMGDATAYSDCGQSFIIRAHYTLI